MDERVIEYFNTYFGGELNESTTHEDLIEAALDLVELRNGVLEVVEGAIRAVKKYAGTKLDSSQLKKPFLNLGLTKDQRQRKINRRMASQTDAGADLVQHIDSGGLKSDRSAARSAIAADPAYAAEPSHGGPSVVKRAMKSGERTGKSRMKKLVAQGQNISAIGPEFSTTRRPRKDSARIAKMAAKIAGGAGLATAGFGMTIPSNDNSNESVNAFNEDKDKIHKFRKDEDDTPHELGLVKSLGYSQAEVDKATADVIHANRASRGIERGEINPKDLEHIPTGGAKNPGEAKRLMNQLRTKAAEHRASKHKHRARGSKARKEREAKGQGRLF